MMKQTGLKLYIVLSFFWNLPEKIGQNRCQFFQVIFQVIQKNHMDLEIPFLRISKITNSITLIVTGLLKLSISFFFFFQVVYFMLNQLQWFVVFEKLFYSIEVVKFICREVSVASLITCLMSVGSVMISSISLLILAICVSSVSLAKSLSVLLNFTRNQLLVSFSLLFDIEFH